MRVMNPLPEAKFRSSLDGVRAITSTRRRAAKTDRAREVMVTPLS